MTVGEDILKSLLWSVFHTIIVSSIKASSFASDLVRGYIAIARSGKTLRLKRTKWLGLVAVGTGNQCRMATD
jgi:hypothetical protein